MDVHVHVCAFYSLGDEEQSNLIQRGSISKLASPGQVRRSSQQYTHSTSGVIIVDQYDYSGHTFAFGDASTTSLTKRSWYSF